LRGRVKIYAAASGASYAIVSDGSRFAVLHATTSLRAMQGQSVVVTHDSKGLAVVRPDLDRVIAADRV
jgi:predicted type IV restriction endonuclease